MVILLSVLLLTYGVIVTIMLINQVKRVDRLTEITNTAVGNLDEIEQLIRDSEEVFNNPRLQEAFAHDDEVGRYFQNLKSMQETLNNYIGNGESI